MSERKRREPRPTKKQVLEHQLAQAIRVVREIQLRMWLEFDHEPKLLRSNHVNSIPRN